MAITPKNWGSFQHYKDRAPPWIKLHHNLLDNVEFHCLPDASRALAPCLWLLASEFEGGRITLSMKALAFRMRRSEIEIAEALKPLIDSEFFSDDSNMLATCYQHASPEERRGEAETEAEAQRGGAAPQSAAAPPPAPLFPTAAREAVAKKQQNGSARSFACAPDGALAREPTNPPAEPKRPAELRQGMSPDVGDDYRSPPRTKSTNVLEPVPEIGTGRRKRTY